VYFALQMVKPINAASPGREGQGPFGAGIVSPTGSPHRGAARFHFRTPRAHRCHPTLGLHAPATTVEALQPRGTNPSFLRKHHEAYVSFNSEDRSPIHRQGQYLVFTTSALPCKLATVKRSSLSTALRQIQILSRAKKLTSIQVRWI